MNAQPETKRPSISKSSSRWVASAILFTALGVGFMFLPVSAWVANLQNHVDALGWAGPLVFILLYALLTVSLVPGTALTIAAGVLFGLFRGTLFAVLGSNLGALAAFLLARTAMRRRVEIWAREHPRFDAIDSALERSGFKVVMLLRLSPIFPFCLLNYVLGLTRVPVILYVLGGAIGMLPGTTMLVYIGSLSTNLARASGGETPEVWRLKLAMRVVGFLATFLVTWWITRMARSALKIPSAQPATPSQDGAISPQI